MLSRHKTRQVSVGRVKIGGDAPVALQTMTSGYTYDVDRCIAEIRKLAQAGADLVRVAVPEKRDTEALPHILAASPVPIVADVHFHFERALEAIAAGVHKIRLNPGNLQDRAKVNRVIAACKERGIPIRVGVNEGGIVERRDKERRAVEKATLAQDYTANLIRLMLEKLEDYLRIFDDNDFHDVVISAKSIDPRVVIDVYTAISQRFDYPLHLGVTHAGPPETGRIRSIAALGTLLANGIGDTIRISYAADPVHEVEDGKELLCALGLRRRSEPELIACPTCGRIEVDLFKLVTQVREKLATEIKLPMKVAVMGCVVNGPGECEGADVAIFAGKGKGIIYVQGEQKQTVAEERMLDALLSECRDLEARVQRGEARLHGSA
ncbi:MAG TPA: flavodoxin-dependent (E)-4-hydroxy-3-methylbut-2-enyl-diphosphate synthase [Phycisphaerae bacterium]|jgi:(E)-4-hydroxy-3-methylbut-2-enyl-diphosphate synthase|nr:flavodoxin-dependent (E)-4-hydroxy-3-methylbut-2-enyl-diphosphate synthase [Phycisphaerae bacterium]HRS29257.1 flavodoxin-dependent (E)-4-hydroxy-3-methylbut-2-enyl-diphosphate synthase [Phycisphaerae bacterium]HRT42863.1 flavodoxin-dependent (E)-4-hydroxy-3-methylbut-2-enyl-diphosphate synthase [Phycisphaerae bacterium]